MKNESNWRPTKFVLKQGRLLASREGNAVGVGSRLVTDLTAAFYDRELQKFAKGKLLDLGCGSAPLYLAYRKLVTEITCVDWANTAHGNTYLDVECDLNGRLPFPDHAFDTIVLSDVLEHVADPENLWTEMSRVLRHGGSILMNTPFCYCIHERPHDYYRYTEFALRRFVQLARLELISLEAAGGSPEVLADFLAKHCQAVPVLGRPLAIFIQWCAARFVATAPGRMVSRKTSPGYPLGYCLVAQKPQSS